MYHLPFEKIYLKIHTRPLRRESQQRTRKMVVTILKFPNSAGLPFVVKVGCATSLINYLP